MKKQNFKSQSERTSLVIDLCKKLKSFPSEYGVVNLYNTQFTAIQKIKQVFNDYIYQDDTNPEHLVGFSGKIYFPEINKFIQYNLPVRTSSTPLFVLKHK